MRHRVAASLGVAACVANIGCGARPGAERASDLRPASLGEAASAALVVGCWHLEWAMDAAARRVAGEAPDSVRLRDEVVFGTPDRLVTPATRLEGRTQASGAPVPWESRFVVNRWRVDDDALRIRFWNGQEDEWNVALGVDSDELVGEARLEVDPEPRDGPIRAGLRGRRIDCSP